MKRKLKFVPTPYLFLALIAIAAGTIYYFPYSNISLPLIQKKTVQKQIKPDLIDFTPVLEETGTKNTTKSANWWLNSGGLVYNSNGIFSTIQGNLDTNNRWFNAYQKSNPTDTDGGLHPQNIFRLININNLQNIRQQMYFKINKTIPSNSSNRNESNGILFFNRYIDGNNLYYTGIRVDGTAIIKKKKNGIYHTIVQQKIYGGVWQKSTKPNLIPENKWIGLRSEVINLNFKEVKILVFINNENNGNWQLIAEGIDDGNKFDGSSFINAGHPGIRTDFMDVEFKGYTITQL